ncbi:MAG: hypothetical protein CMI16_09225 [Opitutaceae bacterium]|nr:hypothetical protein [Opitutaceae bacterium]
MSSHPRLLISSTATNGLRTLEDLKASIQGEWSQANWQSVLASAEKALTKGPILIDDVLPDRVQSMVEAKNPDYVVVEAAGQQVLRAALAHLLTGRLEFKASAMDQLKALYDPEVWPDWIDQAHVKFDYPADLRTGMLSQAIGVAYDWLASSLTDEERAWVIEGLNRRGIQPYLDSMEMTPWWSYELNNWSTVIMGGLGIAGMALDGEHPAAQRLIDLGVEVMDKYLLTYGPEGEFNESVGYAGANRIPVAFFQAHRYWSGGEQNRLAQTPFPEMCEWVMHSSLPPGRSVSVGDCHPEWPIMTGYVAPVAAANQDGVLQWFYQQYQKASDDPYQLVSYDGQLEPISAEGKIPKFKSYEGHGRLVVSRTDWSSKDTACIVHSKAGREENHEHNDLGQVCLDGFGERLIIDLGSPSGYSVDFFDAVRWEYYNNAIRGHNVLMFDGEEQRSPLSEHCEKTEAQSLSGKTVAEQFVPGVGAAWKMDLTPAYMNGQHVIRTVVHFYPGFVAVLDEATTPKKQEISLRWHTRDRAAPDSEGRFTVRGEKGNASALITRLDEGELAFSRNEHEHRVGFDTDRGGAPLTPRRESYVEAKFRGNSCRILTLFNVQAVDTADSIWTKSEGGWSNGDVELRLTEGGLEISRTDQAISI